MRGKKTLAAGLVLCVLAGSAVLLAAVVYVVLALAIGAVTRQDLQTLPKGEKLADRLHLR